MTEPPVPVDPLESTHLFPLMLELADCLCAALEQSPGGETCFCGVIPGQAVPMDFCTCSSKTTCGQAWVRLDSFFPTQRFPQPQADATCATHWAARIQVGVTRCVAGMSSAGNPPGVLEQAESTRVQMGDLAAIQRALLCCLDETPRNYVVGPYLPVGPVGDCAGGAIMVTIRLPNGA